MDEESFAHLVGKHAFLGNERIAHEIYQHMKGGLSDVERFVLLRYFRLPIGYKLRDAFNEADFSSRGAALKSVMAKFPKKWPPEPR